MKQAIAVILMSLVFSGLGMGRENETVQSFRFEPKDSARSDREVPVKVYLDPQQSKKPLPVILFSHGLGGSRENSQYLADQWAAAGYVAVFIQHIGSDEGVWKDAPLLQRMAALKKAAGAKAFFDRMEDVPFVIDCLEEWNQEAGHELAGKMDLKKIGMSGHSFGGLTSQAMAGAKYPGGRDFEEKRIRAILVMSPSTMKRQSPQAAFGEINKPALLMTGTEDGDPLAGPGKANARMEASDRRKVYAAMPEEDKFELVFDGGNHMTFSDRKLAKKDQRDARFHPAILEISTKFWDAYLKADPTAKKWLQSEKPKSDLELTPADIWAWK